MKKTIVAATIMAMTSGVALAEEYVVDRGNQGSGQVKFEGTVASASCTITVAGQHNNATVRLPIVNTNEFKKDEPQGTHHKETPFNIVFSGSTGMGDGQDKVGVSWTEAELENPELGYLKNLAAKEDAATGVSLVISDGKGRHMIPSVRVGTTPAFNDTDSRSSVDFDGTDDKNSATLPFTVSYVRNSSDSELKAGKIESAAIYSVFYE